MDPKILIILLFFCVIFLFFIKNNNKGDKDNKDLPFDIKMSIDKVVV